jgi:competence ComEA-like helix-hairpin-helix protein
VALYARSELKVLLGLAGAVLVGLTAREWRAGFPEHADHLERFDREPAAPREPAAGTEPGVPPRAGPPRRPPGSEPCTPARSHAEPAEPALPTRLDDPRPLDLNLASAAELARLPGVGPSLAGRIVADRERAGPFASADALRRVLGVGPRKFAAIRALVTAGDDRNQTAPPATPLTVFPGEELPDGGPDELPGTTPAEASSDVVGP